ncbi:MAG TPA: hypothetical protein VFR67_17640 [Pilimelia sp.]|nr:hypothetical protein [Pilimelia sp.]
MNWRASVADAATTETTTSEAPARPETPRPGDRTPFRMALFIGGIAVALIGGFGLGRVVGDQPGTGVPPAPGPTSATAAGGHTHAPGTGPHDHGVGPANARVQVGGLAVSASGYDLLPDSTVFAAGRAQTFRFRIIGPDKATVRSYAMLHDKLLHLIVVRRDMSGYQHLHPTMAPDGTWSVPLTLAQPGVWRAYADFAATDTGGGRTPATLGVDLTVAGDYRPRPLPPAERTATVAGFTAGYAGTPVIGSTQPLVFTVTRSGAPVAPERYLGAYGHLVVLREGDMGYVHVHAEDLLTDNAVKFWLAAPSAGRYRMFFDFQVAGAVHTAEFTLAVG